MRLPPPEPAGWPVDARPQRRAGTAWEPVGAEVVALNSSREALHVLDGPAASVWERCDGESTVAEVSAQLADVYRAPVADLVTDVAETCSHLHALGLLDDSRSGTGAAPERPPGGGPRPRWQPGESDLSPPAAGRLGGPVLGPFRALGWDFQVRCDDPAVSSLLERVLRSLGSDGAVPVSTYTLVAPTDTTPGALWLDDLLVTAHRSVLVLYSKLLWHLNVAAVEAAASSHVLLHAAAGDDRGVSVLVSGPIDAGKSTLIAGLVRAGLRYLTDEIVAVQPASLEITPFPKAIFLDSGSWEVLPDLDPRLPVEAYHLQGSQWQVDPARVGTAAMPQARGAQPGLLVFPQYVSQSTTRAIPLSAADAVARLFPQRFAPDEDPVRDLRVLCALARSARAYRLVVGDLDSGVGAVLSLWDDGP